MGRSPRHTGWMEAGNGLRHGSSQWRSPSPSRTRKTVKAWRGAGAEEARTQPLGCRCVDQRAELPRPHQPHALRQGWDGRGQDVFDALNEDELHLGANLVGNLAEI